MMVRALPVLVATLLAGCTPPPAAPPATRAASGDPTLNSFLLGQGYQPVQLHRLATGHFMIAGTADSIPLTFIIDTGASHTILDRNRSDRFAVVLADRNHRASGLGVTGQQVSGGVLSRVSLGPIQLDSLPVAVLDLSHINLALRQMGIEPVDGIIGADMLARKPAVIDYGTLRLYVRTD